MKKVSLILLNLFVISLLFTGCASVASKNEMIKTTNLGSKPIIEKGEIKLEPDNMVDHRKGDEIASDELSSGIDVGSSRKGSNLESRDKLRTVKQDGKTVTITNAELAEILNKYLTIKMTDYKVTEHLIYNYTKFNDKSIIGMFFTEDSNEEKGHDQYYKDVTEVKGKSSKLREITAVRYKNKKNLEYEIGTFKSRSSKKKVELQWEDLSPDDELASILTDSREYDFSGITDFYEFKGLDDFKAKGQTNLLRFKSWLGVSNSGTESLRDVEAELTDEVIEKGKTIEKTVTVKPLQEKFLIDYDITVKGNKITVYTNPTEQIGLYYKLFPEFQIQKCEYQIEIEDTTEEPEVELAEGEQKEEISSDSEAQFINEEENEEIKEEETKSKSSKKSSKKTSSKSNKTTSEKEDKSIDLDNKVSAKKKSTENEEEK